MMIVFLLISHLSLHWHSTEFGSLINDIILLRVSWRCSCVILLNVDFWSELSIFEMLFMSVECCPCRFAFKLGKMTEGSWSQISAFATKNDEQTKLNCTSETTTQLSAGSFASVSLQMATSCSMFRLCKRPSASLHSRYWTGKALHSSCLYFCSVLHQGPPLLPPLVLCGQSSALNSVERVLALVIMKKWSERIGTGTDLMKNN